MTTFVDTVFLIAILLRDDEQHDRALAWDEALAGDCVVSEFVLLEFADALCVPALRALTQEMIEKVRQDPDIEVVPASAEWIERGYQLYCSRPDKAWSLTDCISFEIMHDRGIADALTHDRHFEQAGSAPCCGAIRRAIEAMKNIRPAGHILKQPAMLEYETHFAPVRTRLRSGVIVGCALMAARHMAVAMAIFFFLQKVLLLAFGFLYAAWRYLRGMVMLLRDDGAASRYILKTAVLATTITGIPLFVAGVIILLVLGDKEGFGLLAACLFLAGIEGPWSLVVFKLVRQEKFHGTNAKPVAQ